MTTETKQKNTGTEIPEGWVETTLGEVCERIGDGLHGTPEYSDFGGYYFLNGNNIKEGKLIIKSDTKKVDHTEYEKHKKALGDSTILLSINGTIGNLAKFNNEKCILGKSAAYLNINQNVDSNYIFYLMLDKKFQYDILKNANGSTIKNVGLTQLRNYKFNIPSSREQKAIADVLSSLDNKIELLREQNITLEKTAQTIFKEWFGKYSVDNPKELPEGWRVGKLYEFGEIICGKTPSKDNKQNFDGSFPFIKIPDMHTQMFILNTTDSLSATGSNSQPKKLLPKNSICVSCIATVGLVSITTEESHTNQQINSIVSKESFYTEYLYHLLKGMKKKLNDLGGGGTATLNVNTGIFMELDVLIPNNQSLKDFSEKVKPLFEKIKNNAKENIIMSKTRDTLLPKLIKGEIRVK